MKALLLVSLILFFLSPPSFLAEVSTSSPQFVSLENSAHGTDNKSPLTNSESNESEEESETESAAIDDDDKLPHHYVWSFVKSCQVFSEGQSIFIADKISRRFFKPPKI